MPPHQIQRRLCTQPQINNADNEWWQCGFNLPSLSRLPFPPRIGLRLKKNIAKVNCTKRISVWRRHDHRQAIKHSLPLIKQTSIIKPCRGKWNPPPPPKKKTVDQCLCRSAAVRTNEINSDGMSSGSNNPPKLLSNMDCLANPVFGAPVSVSEVTSTLKLMSVQSRRRLLLCRVQV